MSVTNQVVDWQFSNLKLNYGGRRDNCLCLLCLKHEFDSVGVDMNFGADLHGHQNNGPSC